MLYVLVDRREDPLHWLPKGGVCAEVGVFTGVFAAKIDEVVKPERLHLVDAWDFARHWPSLSFSTAEDEAGQAAYRAWFTSHVPDYDGGPPNRFYERMYDTLRQKYAGDGRVRLHRGLSRDVVKEFPDGYFDFIYLDASHAYVDVLDDLVEYAKKLRDGGIIMGDDFYDDLDRPSDYRRVGTVQALSQFLKRSSFKCIAVTGPGESNFVICRRISPYVQTFLDNLYESNKLFIEINDAQLANYCAKTFTSSTGFVRKYVPSF
jgi:hypothetical protein